MTDPHRVTLELVTGSINSPEGSGKMYVFHSPHRDSVRSGEKEDHFSRAAQECPELATKLSLASHPSRTNVLPEVGGKVFAQQWQFKDREVLKVWAQHSRFGSLRTTAALFIRLRAEGPLAEINCRVPGQISDAGPQWIIRGRFDVTAPDDAERIGVTILEAARNNFEPGFVRKLFEIKELAPELKALPTFDKVRVAGTEKTALIKTKRRKLRL